MAMEGFCRNVVGPPEWEFEAMDSVVWVQCANLCRVCVKSIDSRVLGHGHSSEWVTPWININKLILHTKVMNFALLMDGRKAIEAFGTK